MLRHISNKLFTRENKRRLIILVFVLIVGGAVVLTGLKLYEDHVKQAIQYADGTPKQKQLTDKQLEEQYRENKKEADENYNKGVTGMNGDDISGSTGNTESGDAELIGQDWYDNEGNLLWKGIIKDSYTEEERAAFEKAYQKYEEVTGEENENTRLTVNKKGSAASRLINICFEYNEKIPYAESGYSYYLGYYVQDEYDNTPYIKRGQQGNGLCGLGYVTWVMRNVFGKTPDAIRGKKIDISKVQAVKADALEIGDICVASSQNGTLYGVVAYMQDETPVVSMEDSLCTVNFPTGCNHYAYIKSIKNEYIANFPPVEFNSFYRLNEEWR